jgi:hypothetical protein
MEMQKTSRVKYALVGSGITFVAGIYCLFLTMAFPNYLYIIFGGIMLAGAVAMKKGKNEQSCGILVLFSAVLILLTLNDLVYATLGDKILKIGSGPNDYITFSIIERFIVILLVLFGGSLALIGGFDALLMQDGFLKRLADFKVHYIMYLVNSILTIFAIGWVAFYLFITRTIIDSLLFLPIFIGLLALFFYGWRRLLQMKNLGYVLGFHLFCAIFFGFLTLLNFFYFTVAFLNVITIGVMLTANSDYRKSHRLSPKQRMVKTGIALITMALLGAFMTFPYYYPWDATPILIEVPDNSQKVVEINWAYGSEMSTDWDWLARPEILNMITTINSNQDVWGINISVTVPLVRECFNATLGPIIAGILSDLYSNGVTIDLMPIVDSAVLGDKDEYIHDDNIDEFAKVYREMKAFLANWSISDCYRSLVIDLERTTTIKINELILNWMSGQNAHVQGQKKLTDFFNELRANGEKIAGAFFGFHIFDLVDLDDAQQDFFMISIVPPYDWDFIAAMIYQSGPGSNYSVYAYCQDMNYHFGDRGVPYAVTMRSSYDDILTRLRIMKNTGFPKIGMWAMHELFANGTNFGMSGHKNSTPSKDSNGKEIPDPWTTEMFMKLHEDLSKDGPVQFYFDGYQSENSYEMFTLVLDLWLYRRPVYTHTWPVMGEWLPNQFVFKTILVVIAYGAIAFSTFFMAWKPYRLSRKAKPQEAEKLTKSDKAE